MLSAYIFNPLPTYCLEIQLHKSYYNKIALKIDAIDTECECEGKDEIGKAMSSKYSYLNYFTEIDTPNELLWKKIR